MAGVCTVILDGIGCSVMRGVAVHRGMLFTTGCGRRKRGQALQGQCQYQQRGERGAKDAAKSDHRFSLSAAVRPGNLCVPTAG